MDNQLIQTFVEQLSSQIGDLTAKLTWTTIQRDALSKDLEALRSELETLRAQLNEKTKS